MKKKTIFQTFFLIFYCCISFSQTFFDNNGKVILYYNSDKNVLFDYLGTPKFYFRYESNKIVNVYNFSGQHIAWLSEGLLRDHKGRILASMNGRITNINYSIEPIKPIEKIIPIKGIEQISPNQPFFLNEFSYQNILQVENASIQNNSSYPQNDYSSRATFSPYELPKDAILNALQTLNNRHNRLIEQGYIYDSRTDKYYTKENYAPIEASRKIVANSYVEMVAQARASNSNAIKFDKPKKRSLYWAYVGNTEFGIQRTKVSIKKNGKIRGFYFSHPIYGYMFFGVYDKTTISFPYQDVKFIGDITKFRRKEVGLGSSFLEGYISIFWHKGIENADDSEGSIKEINKNHTVPISTDISYNGSKADKRTLSDNVKKILDNRCTPIIEENNSDIAILLQNIKRKRKIRCEELEETYLKKLILAFPNYLINFNCNSNAKIITMKLK